MHGITSNRITHWLCLLTLPEEKLREIEALGDFWDRQVVTERQLCKISVDIDYSPFYSAPPLLPDPL